MPQRAQPGDAKPVQRGSAREYGRERRARDGLQALIDSAPVGVAVFDAGSGAPLLLNREALRIGRRLRLPDRPLTYLLQVLNVRRGDGREVSLDGVALAETLRGGETVRAEEVVLSVPDGRALTALVNATLVRSADGEVESVAVTFQDLTAQQESEQLRAEFLGLVSHELHTPLMSIRGSTSTLLRDEPGLEPAEIRGLLQIIEAQTERMRELIGQLLDMARVESGAFSVEPGPVDLITLVDEARNIFLQAGRAHQIRVDLDLDLPLVLADRRRIVQVLSNLLVNAASSSEESSTIQITAAPAADHVTVCVSDDGCGLSAQRLPDLFRQFSRADSEGGGAGLGLAICKSIIEAHGGRIWAESDGVGRGARLTFTLSLAERVAAAVTSSAAAGPDWGRPVGRPHPSPRG